MKKLFYSLMLCSFFVACSNEDDIVMQDDQSFSNEEVFKISDLKEVAEEVSKEDIVLSDLEKNKVLERSKKVDSEIVSKFESLIAAWKNEINTNPKTMFSSSTLDYKQLPQFKSLQEMGSVIIPLIMEKLLDEENFFMLPLYDTLQLDSNLKIVYNKNDRKCLEGEQNRARRTVRMWVNSL